MQKRTEEVVLSIAKGISTATGHIFFQSLMKHLAESLGSDYAFIGEIMKGHPGRVRTVVLWGHGRLADNFEYDLTGTPCADVVRQQLCGYRSGIQQLFPLDQLLADMRIEGYVGAPLRDADRKTLGLLVVMFEKPVENLALAESILNIFGVRAASELERQQREEALRESEQRLNLVLEATSSGLWDWNIQTGDVYFDERWIKSLGYSPEEVSPHVNFWEQIIHPEDLPRVRKAWRDHFQGRSVIYECENRLRTKSGMYRLNLDRGKVVEWDADGQPLRMVGTDTDITNRKQTEDQLRLTQFAIDRAADAIFIVDTHKRFLYVNNEACRSLEYTRDELMELTVSDIAPTHESETFRKRFHILKETGVVRYETIHRTKSGRDIPIDLTINLFELKGAILMCAVARDITERKRGQAALSESEARFRSLVSHLPGAVYRCACDSDWTMEFLSEPIEHLCGYPASDFLASRVRSYSSVIHPNDRQLVERVVLGAVAQCQDYAIEYRLLHKDGDIRWVYEKGQGVFAADGQVLWLDGAIFDITERKMAEEALRESQGRFRELAENIKEVFWMSDPQKNEILYVSPAYEQIWGRTCESLYTSPRSWLEAIHTDDRARILDAAVTKQAGGTYDEEYRIVQPTRSTRWIHDRAFPVRDAAGTVCRIVGIAEDITERKQAENQVQQSLEQLRELSGQLEMAEELERKRIARELHDEFGQMITALKLDLTWLKRQHDQTGNGGQPDAFAYKLQAIEKVVNTMAQSTRRIASSLRPSVLDDLGLVPALQWQARDFQERTGLECRIRLSADVAQRKIDDTTATALFRIAQELLTNIIRHANAQRVQISLATDDDVLAMIVTDDGKGITENDLAKATSFGLRGIRERVALIGGEIKITGDLHQGTIVTLRVPLAMHT